MESLITFIFWPHPASGVQPISFCHVGAQSLHVQTLPASYALIAMLSLMFLLFQNRSLFDPLFFGHLRKLFCPVFHRRVCI